VRESGSCDAKLAEEQKIGEPDYRARLSEEYQSARSDRHCTHDPC